MYGATIFARGEFAEAEKELLAGLKIAEEYKFHFWAAVACLWLGQLYDESGEYNKSIIYYDQVVDITEKSTLFPTRIKYARCALIKAKFFINSESTKILEAMIALYRGMKEHYPNLNKAIDIFKVCGADGWVEKYEKGLAEIS